MTTNCKNCGAALKNGKCEYCGTEYTNFINNDSLNPLYGVKVWRGYAIKDFDPVLSTPDRRSKYQGKE